MEYFILFGGVIFIVGWMKPAVAKIEEGFAAADRETSEIKDELTRHYQIVNDQLDDLKKIVIARMESVPASSKSEAHKP